MYEQIDPAKCRVISFPSLIWVFGGAIGENTMRDVFWAETLKMHRSESWLPNLKRPEDFQDWWAFSGYTDILLFERDACHLAKIVVLFAESPGSYAELGAFALDDAIVHKLLVVVPSKFREGDKQKSFITLGPLARVANTDQDAVCVVGPDDASQLEPYDIDGIFSSITHKFSKQKGASHSLNIKDPSHRLLMMADIVDLLIVAHEADVQNELEKMGLPAIGRDEARRHAKLLNFLGFIHLRERSKDRFLVRNQESIPLASYTAMKDHKFDRLNFKIRRQEYVMGDARLNSMLEKPK